MQPRQEVHKPRAKAGPHDEVGFPAQEQPMRRASVCGWQWMEGRNWSPQAVFVAAASSLKVDVDGGPDRFC